MSKFISLCLSCPVKCSSDLKGKLAQNGTVTNIYLKNGTKITYACQLHKQLENRAIYNAPIFLGREGMMKII